MKGWIAMGLLGLSVTVLAQEAQVTLDTPELLARPWTPLASSVHETDAYQLTHAVPYAAGSATPNKNYDVILRKESKGHDGKVSQVSFEVFRLTCLPNGDMDRDMNVLGTHAYASDQQGNPNNPADAHIILNPASVNMADIEDGSLEASIAKKICGKK